MEEEERALFFDFPQGPYSPGLPLKVKWFSERGYKIIDIQGSKVAALLNVKAVDGTHEMFAIVDPVMGKINEQTLINYMRTVGAESTEDCFRIYLKRLNVDMKKVLSFACCKRSSFMITERISQRETSMVPGDPSA